MTKEDVAHLAHLARIELSEERCAAFTKEFDDILGYVEQIKEVAGAASSAPAVGVHHTVLRDDANPHEPGRYTEALLDAAPNRRGRYVQVKKIIDADAN